MDSDLAEQLVRASEWADAARVEALLEGASSSAFPLAQHAAALGPGWHEDTEGLRWKDPTAGSRVRQTLALLSRAASSADLLDAVGRTPLLAAAQEFHPLLVLAWVEAGADVAARDAEGATVLHALVSPSARVRAREHGLPTWGTHWCPTAVALIERGADPWARDAQGATAVDCVLKEAGALGSDPGATAERARLEKRFAQAHAAWMERSVPSPGFRRPSVRL